MQGPKEGARTLASPYNIPLELVLTNYTCCW